MGYGMGMFGSGSGYGVTPLVDPDDPLGINSRVLVPQRRGQTQKKEMPQPTPAPQAEKPQQIDIAKLMASLKGIAGSGAPADAGLASADPGAASQPQTPWDPSTDPSQWGGGDDPSAQPPAPFAQAGGAMGGMLPGMDASGAPAAPPAPAGGMFGGGPAPTAPGASAAPAMPMPTAGGPTPDWLKPTGADLPSDPNFQPPAPPKQSLGSRISGMFGGGPEHRVLGMTPDTLGRVGLNLMSAANAPYSERSQLAFGGTQQILEQGAQKQKTRDALKQLNLTPPQMAYAEANPDIAAKLLGQKLFPQSDYQFLNTQQGGVYRGEKSSGKLDTLVEPREPAAKVAAPPNWETRVIADRVVAYNPQDPKQTLDMGKAPPNSLDVQAAKRAAIVNDGTGRDYTQALTNPAEEAAAQAYSQGNDAPAKLLSKGGAAMGFGPVVMSRIMGRAQTLNPEFAAKNVDFTVDKKTYATAAQIYANGTLADGKLKQSMEVVRQAAKALNPSQFPSENQMKNWVATGTGSALPGNLGLALNTMAIDYAQAANGTLHPTVSDLEESRGHIAKNISSMDQIDGTLSIIENEIDRVHSTQLDNLTDMRARAATGAAPASGLPGFRGNDHSSSQAAPAPPRIGEIQDGHKYIGGDPGSPASWQVVQ